MYIYTHMCVCVRVGAYGDKMFGIRLNMLDGRVDTAMSGFVSMMCWVRAQGGPSFFIPWLSDPLLAMFDGR